MPQAPQADVPARDPDSDRSLAVLALALAVLCYGSVPVWLRLFRVYLDPWTVNAVRYSVAALFWLPFVIVLDRRRRSGGGPMAGRNVWRDALIPAAVNLVGQVGWGVSPYFVNAPTIGFVIRLSFLFTVVFGFIFVPAERLLARCPSFLAGAAACLAGVAMMFLDSLLAGGGGSLPGMAILLGTTVFWGGYGVSIRRCMSGYPLRLSFGVVSLYTAGGLVALMLAFGDYGALAGLSGGLWGGLVASAFLGIAFGHVLYYRGIHRLGPVVASGILMASPFVTYATATVLMWAYPAVFQAEGITLIQLLGGLTVVGGGILLVRARARIESARRAGDGVPGSG